MTMRRAASSKQVKLYTIKCVHTVSAARHLHVGMTSIQNGGYFLHIEVIDGRLTGERKRHELHLQH